MQTINRQSLAEYIHANAVAKGFWPTNEDGTYKYSPEHHAMLVITELSEAVEADRKGRKADPKRYSGLLTHSHKLQGGIGVAYRELKAKADREKRPLWEIAFEYYIKDTVEDELADAYIRLLDMWGAYCGHQRYNSADCSVEDIANKPPAKMRYLIRKKLPVQSLSEQLLYIVREVSGRYQFVEYNISMSIYLIEIICDLHNINLLWHIEEKMCYNESRPPLNGKEY